MDRQLFYKIADKYLAGTATESEQRLMEAYWDRLSSDGLQELTEQERIRLRVFNRRRNNYSEDNSNLSQAVYSTDCSSSSCIIHCGDFWFYCK